MSINKPFEKVCRRFRKFLPFSSRRGGPVYDVPRPDSWRSYETTALMACKHTSETRTFTATGSTWSLRFRCTTSRVCIQSTRSGKKRNGNGSSPSSTLRESRFEQCKKETGYRIKAISSSPTRVISIPGPFQRDKITGKRYTPEGEAVREIFTFSFYILSGLNSRILPACCDYDT